MCGWLGHRWVCYSCRLRGPKSVRSSNGLPLLALRHLVSLPVSTPLRIVNRCWSGFPCKWRYINVETFALIVAARSHPLKAHRAACSGYVIVHGSDPAVIQSHPFVIYFAHKAAANIHKSHNVCTNQTQIAVSSHIDPCYPLASGGCAKYILSISRGFSRI